MNALLFDTETTGKKEPRMVEGAWLLVDEALNIVDSFCRRFNPGKPIELEALTIHNILDEEVADCPPAASFCLPPFVEYLVGHQIDYDWEVIGKPKIRRICTKALARKAWPDLDSHRQGSLLYHLRRSEAKELVKNAHSAEYDVRNLRIVLGHIVNFFGTKSWEELWRVSEIARVPTVMPFGKHKGMAMKDVPWSYKSWLLKQPDVDPYLVQALRGTPR